jgi:pyruvate dehydrogenase E1 component beta subunit
MSTTRTKAGTSYMTAINTTLREEMTRDERIIILGQSVEVGTFGLTPGLLGIFGPSRVRDMPICENTMMGMGVGASMCGLRPFVDLSIASFAYLAMDQIVNQAAKNRVLFGGQTSMPLVINLLLSYRSNAAAQHTDRPHAMLMNVPGLKLVGPQTPADGAGLLKTALRSDDPVVFMTDTLAASSRGEFVADADPIPLGKAAIAREGSDVTIVSVFTRRLAMQAADELAKEGISAEVVDPRSLYPIDWETILGSAAKTRRVVVSDIAHQPCSAASEISVRIFEELFSTLQAPVQRVCTPHVHIPYAPAIEQRFFPDAHKIAAAARKTLG